MKADNCILLGRRKNLRVNFDGLATRLRLAGLKKPEGGLRGPAGRSSQGPFDQLQGLN